MPLRQPPSKPTPVDTSPAPTPATPKTDNDVPAPAAPPEPVAPKPLAKVPEVVPEVKEEVKVEKKVEEAKTSPVSKLPSMVKDLVRNPTE